MESPGRSENIVFASFTKVLLNKLESGADEAKIISMIKC